VNDERGGERSILFKRQALFPLVGREKTASRGGGEKGSKSSNCKMKDEKRQSQLVEEDPIYRNEAKLTGDWTPCGGKSIIDRSL